MRKAKVSQRADGTVIIERTETQLFNKQEVSQHMNRLRFQILHWQQQIQQMQQWIAEAEAELAELERVASKP